MSKRIYCPIYADPIRRLIPIMKRIKGDYLIYLYVPKNLSIIFIIKKHLLNWIASEMKCERGVVTINITKRE